MMDYYPEDEWEQEDTENIEEDCDYDLCEYCLYPDLKALGCEVNCPLYLEYLKMLEEDEG